MPYPGIAHVIARHGALRTAMDQAGLSTRTLAARTSDPSVARMAIHAQTHPESGRTITLERATSIARALNMDVRDLFAYPDGTPIGGI